MRIRFQYFLIFSFLLMSGCSNKSDISEDLANTLRVDVGSEAPTLDPALAEDTASNRIMYDLFAGLVDFDQSNKIIPGMASSWDISADKKTYTFYLKKGLKFSDGSPITASDFVYSWRRLVDPKTASPYNYLIGNIVNASSIIEGKSSPSTLAVFAPDSYTFVVKLVRPNAGFIPSLNLMNVGVVPQKVIEKFGAKWTDPQNIVTSGAYTLKEHIVNGYILAQKNPYFYDANNVHIEKIKYLPYEDKNATIPSYKSGGLDLTFQSLPTDQFDSLKAKYPKEIHVFPWEAMSYYDFNATNPELANNKKLRQALSMGIDREKLAKEVMRDGYLPLYSTVTSTIDDGKFRTLSYNWASWPRDKQIQEAKKLYLEAGYSQSKPFHITITYNSNEIHKKIALSVAAMWKGILGVDVLLRNQDWKTFIQARHKGDYQIARDGWVADFDAISAYTVLYKCNSPQSNSHWCNPEFDKLISQADVETDPKKQTDLYLKALELPLNDYATIPLLQETVRMLVNPRVIGYNPDNNHLNHVQSKWMSLTK